MTRRSTGLDYSSWKAAASQGLQNPESGKCLDDPSGSTTNGTQLDINSCSSTAAQRWQRPYNGLAYAGELTSGVSGKCLDNSGAGTSNGNQVDIVSCDGGTGSQLWTVRDDGTVRIQNKCLDVKSSSTANGTLVDLYGCNGTGAQQWVPAPFGYLINPHSGKCLDDPSSSTTNGTQLDIFTCNGASGQKWTLPSTTVPAVPTSVSVTAGAAAATLSWTPPASTGGVPLTGYTVTASPGGATASAGPYATSATVAGLTPGTAYTFTVTAASTIGSATTAASTAVTPANETAWTYDHAANMLTQTADGITTSDSYNGDEELTKAVTGTSTTAYSYDSAGHQTAAGSIAYSWNGAGYLSRAVTPAGTFTYSYDASGDLSATNLNGTLLQGVTWDINGPLPRAVTDTTTAGSPAADYLYGPGGPALMTTPAGTYSPARDWLGSITGLVNSAGMQVTSTTYSAYGTPSTTDLSSPAPTSSLGYAGSYALPGGTGLSDMRARDYNPATGAFTSLDPMVTVSGQPYAYASDVPDYYADPSGRIVIVDNLVAGAIGAIVGAGATLVNDMIYGKKINWADVGISLASGFAYGAAADECGICAGAASAAVGNTLTQLNDGGWSFSHFDFSQLMAETGQGALMGSFDDYMGSGGGEHVAENASEAARAGLWTFGPDLTVGSTDPAGALLSATSPPAPTLGVACG